VIVQVDVVVQVTMIIQFCLEVV